MAMCSNSAQGTQQTQRSPNPNLEEARRSPNPNLEEAQRSPNPNPEEAQRSPNPNPEHVGHCPKQMRFSSLRVNVVTFDYCGLLVDETKLAFLLTLSIGSQCELSFTKTSK
jgi:hypothetical protein